MDNFNGSFIYGLQLIDSIHTVLFYVLIACIAFLLLLIFLHYQNLKNDTVQLDKDIKCVMIVTAIVIVLMILIPTRSTFITLWLVGEVKYHELEGTNETKLYIDYLLDKIGALKDGL